MLRQCRRRPPRKRRAKGRVVAIGSRLVFGAAADAAAALKASKVSRSINASFIERQSATGRHRNARKGRKTYGLFLFLDGPGACVLINGDHPPEKRRASIAHEYAHLIVDRHAAGVDDLAATGRRPAKEGGPPSARRSGASASRRKSAASRRTRSVTSSSPSTPTSGAN